VGDLFLTAIEPAQVLPLLTGHMELPAEVLGAVQFFGRARLYLDDAGEHVPVAELEAVPSPPGWRLAAVACDGPRHPSRSRYRAAFDKLRALVGDPDGPCQACGGRGWLPAGEATHGLIMRAAGFRMWRGVPLPMPDPLLQAAAARAMVDVFLSMGLPPTAQTKERPPGARAGNGPGAIISTEEPAPAAPPEAPAHVPESVAGEPGDEEV
jgi:hypothetical protein